MSDLVLGMARCRCEAASHRTKLVAITGGPGAGKTAVLEMASRAFCEHVAILPEAASIVFGGGFPRRSSDAARRAAQRAIFDVQREVERLAIDEGSIAVALCDRGTLDGLAYWPGSSDELFQSVHTTRESELARYSAVVHLRTPADGQGYDHSNALRIESAGEAAKIDARIALAWDGHPDRHFIATSEDFVEKAIRALKLIRETLPECCHRHGLPSEELSHATRTVP